MGQRLTAIIISVFITAAGMKVISYILWKIYGFENTLIINEGTLGIGVLCFTILGAATYAIIGKIYPDWSENDTKKAGVGTISCIFASKICASGACLPGAVLSTALSIPGLLCVILGAGAMKYFKYKKLDN